MNHRTSRRAFLRALSAGASLAVLAACGQPASVSPPPPAATDPTVPPAQPTALPPPTEAPAPQTPDATAVPTAVPTPEPAFPMKTPYMEYGIVNHLYYTDRERVMTLTQIAGFDWVRQQIQWKDIEGEGGVFSWDEVDQIIDSVKAKNAKLLISITKAPSFYSATNGMPDDPVKMADFTEVLMRRYGNKIDAVEIWNEQNLAVENGGRVTVDDAGRYVEMLVESFKRVKAISPSTYVLAGAPSSTGVTDPAIAVADEDYYHAMYRYKDGLIKDYFDAQAVHPGGSANPPETFWPENPSTAQGWTDHPTFYFRHVESVRRFMVEEGVGDHQIWITEYGWATQNNTPGYEFGNQVSFEQQAQYIVGAMEWCEQYYRNEDGRPWMGVMFLWNMNFAVLWGGEGNPLHEQAAFGILNPDWSPRPAFLAIQSHLAEIKSKPRT